MNTQTHLLKSKNYYLLSFMMFLQYAVWGAWLPILSIYVGTYLKFTPREIGLISCAPAIGALLAPFISGQIADRYFSSERCLGLLHFIAGILAILLSYQTKFWPFLIIAVLKAIVYIPTLSLTNSIAFVHVEDREKHFPWIRVWGTIGWIVAGWVYAQLWLQGTPESELMEAYRWAFRFSGILSLLLAFYSFFLPHTPPSRDAKDIAVVKAFRLLRYTPLLVIFVLCLPVLTVHTFYFIWTGPFLKYIGFSDANIPRVMTIGQMSEILLMVAVPLSLKRFGFKFTMGVGLLAYLLRFTLFAIGKPSILSIIAIGLHGFCYGFFISVVFIFVDKCAPADIKASAQTLIGILILGIGPLVGSLFAGELAELVKTNNGLNYSLMYWIVAGISFITFILFLILFRPSESVLEPSNS